jgi:regulator of sigma E protease
VDSITLVDSILNFSSYLTFLGDSNLTAFLGKLTAFGKVALGLGFVIFIHELGHFLAAKTFGVRCDKFYVGFDVPIRIGPIRLPRTLGKFKWGETEYGIGIIPLGGYVKMLGQDDDPRAAKEEAERARAGGTEVQPLDPRSYPAKPVWQRMIIISAGVVMNLVSAVFLAGAAYFFGVPYTPSVVGNPTAGGPAWLAGFQSGDQVVRVGSAKDDHNMRFEDMTVGFIIHGLDEQDKPLEVQVDRGGERHVFNPVPTPKYRPDKKTLLGFTIERSNVLVGDVFHPFSKLDAEQLGLKPNDRVVSVDGEKLPADARFDVALASELRRRMAAKWNQPVTLGIERRANAEKGIEAKDFEVVIPAIAKKTLGIGFGIDPVTAVRPGSPGEKAGFQVGDRITAIDGAPVVDALRLPIDFAARAGNEVKITVKRGNEDVDLSVAAPVPAVFDYYSPTGSGELSLGGIGVAFGVSSTISSIDPELAKSGTIQVGDKLAQYRWSPTEEQKKAADKFIAVDVASQTRKVDSYYNIVSLMEFVQEYLPVDSKLDCELIRDNKTVSTALNISNSADQFTTDERGLLLAAITNIHKTSDIVTALKLGLWETKKRFGEVLGFLKLLFSGKVGMDGVAGPLRLFDIATQEASNSTSRLLLFLTLLSANLAILNFLPIPALDGGHMMFLTAEAIRGKPINEDWQIRLTMAGVLGLLALMAFVILKDIGSYL